MTDSAAGREAGREAGFQQRALAWLMACFSMEVCRDGQERNHRFLEESLELVQSLGCTASEAHQLVDYVYGRPPGEPAQELGGVMVTLAALCFPYDLDMTAAAETELARVWSKIDVIRAKQATKPKHSPLPTPTPADAQKGHAALHRMLDMIGKPDATDRELAKIFCGCELDIRAALQAMPATKGE